MVSTPTRRFRIRAFLAVLFGTRAPSLVADCVLLLARAVLAWIFVYHGSRRLFGAFNGPGISHSAAYFSQTAHLRPGVFFAVVGGVIEFGGGIALVIGFAARLAGAAIVMDMMMAIVTVTWANGINATGPKSGYELNLALGSLALVVTVLGAGHFSIDAVLERRLSGGQGSRPEEEPSCQAHSSSSRRIDSGQESSTTRGSECPVSSISSDRTNRA
jgi:putative oxidoreductase